MLRKDVMQGALIPLIPGDVISVVVATSTNGLPSSWGRGSEVPLVHVLAATHSNQNVMCTNALSKDVDGTGWWQGKFCSLKTTVPRHGYGRHVWYKLRKCLFSSAVH